MLILNICLFGGTHANQLMNPIHFQHGSESSKRNAHKVYFKIVFRDYSKKGRMLIVPSYLTILHEHGAIIIIFYLRLFVFAGLVVCNFDANERYFL